MFVRVALACLLVTSLAVSFGWAQLAQSELGARSVGESRKIVLIAGRIDPGHGRGTHEYQKTIELLAKDLRNFEDRLNYQVETHFNGWPEDVADLDDADTIILVSDGSDRNLTNHPFFVGKRLETIEQLMDRGCGLVLIHWSTFWPEKYRDKVLEWAGGYFDYQTGPAPRNWFSKIQTFKTECTIATPGHRVSAGVKRFPLREEFYYNLQFADQELGNVVPILQTRAPNESGEQTVAWAFERKSGGRGFGFTGGHFFENWQITEFRKMVENAVLWTAGIAVPPRGVITQDRPRQVGQVDVLDARRINTLMISGDNHPAHNWRSTNEVLSSAFRQDPRVAVESRGIEYLENPRLQDFDVVVFNYCNWKKKGLSDEAKRNFSSFVKRGGGLILVHFANGAFHFSLPEAAESDWPEYRKLCRRVWDHGKSGHDSYGRFQVDIRSTEHPVLTGVESFETVDELYFRQAGELPVEILATAKSSVTQNDEPMAMVYQYGRGRVFQTVLGHSAESLRTPGTSRMLRNAVAWTAGRSVDDPQQTLGSGLVQVDGESALDARVGYVRVALHNDSLENFEVSCRTKLYNQNEFNILVAQHPKSSHKHWELYSYAKSGYLSFYCPGYTPSEIKSAVNICDDQWHDVVARFNGRQVELLVDGESVVNQKLTRNEVNSPLTGPLTIGALASEQFGCNGLIASVRLTMRDGDDVQDAGQWEFNSTSVDQIQDRSELRQESEFVRTGFDQAYLSKWTPKSRQNTRFPYENETDPDWVDHRFSQMDTGPSFCHSIRVPGRGIIPKAIAYQDPSGRAHWIYNSEKFRVEAIWSGEFLALPPARFGILRPPSVAGAMKYLCDEAAGWQVKGVNGWRDDDDFRLDGFVVTTNGIQFHHLFEETIEVAMVGDIPRIRHHLAPRQSSSGGLVQLNLGKSSGRWIASDLPNAQLVNNRLSWELPRNESHQLDYGVGNEPGAELPESSPVDTSPRKFDSLSPIVTRGILGKDDGAFAVDTISLPYDNPYRALLFTSGFDFLPNGRAVVCTVHGDVWLVDGVDADLDELVWHRVASGLYQPLGLKVVNGDAYVMCRDRIIRLELSDDLDLRQAVFYHTFNEGLVVTGQNHAYAMSLETDPDGNFYFIKSGGSPPHGGTMLKVDSRGDTIQVFATGYRHANGMGISPEGVITSADNEGNWIPTTRIDVVRQGGFYGHMPTHRRPLSPKTYDPPLIWLPRELDNSAGGQVWIDSPSWGPLNGTMLHLSYGRCTANVVLPQELWSGGWQAAAYQLQITPFISGGMRGRFNSRDGHLYVCGLDGWQTAAVRDGGFQRVRATGKKHYQPNGFHVKGNAIQIMFPEKLDRQSVETAAWSVEQWNYRYSKDYGSDHYRVSNPDVVGHDSVTVDRVSLSEDGKKITLTFEKLVPVMQMNIRAELIADDGSAVSLNLFNTINEIED